MFLRNTVASLAHPRASKSRRLPLLKVSSVPPNSLTSCLNPKSLASTRAVVTAESRATPNIIKVAVSCSSDNLQRRGSRWTASSPVGSTSNSFPLGRPYSSTNLNSASSPLSQSRSNCSPIRAYLRNKSGSLTNGSYSSPSPSAITKSSCRSRSRLRAARLYSSKL